MLVKRDKYLDYARGIAIILVMYCHYFYEKTFFKNWIYTFHIPLFFIITGIILGKRKSNDSFDFKKNFKSLMIPYYVMGVISIIALIFLNIINGISWSTDLLYNIKSLMLLNGIKALWFLPCLFFAKLFYFNIKQNFKDTGKRNLIIFIISVFAFVKLDFISLFFYNIFRRVLIATTFLFIGDFLNFKIEEEKISIIKIVVLFLLTLIMTKIMGNMDLYYVNLKDYFGYFLAAVFGSLFILLSCKYLENKNLKLRLLNFIGKNTLIILGTHMVLGYYVKKIFYLITGMKVFASNLYFSAFIELILVLIIEIIIILIFNKFKEIRNAKRK